MVRLIEERARFPPGALLVPPIGEFVANHREGVWTYLRVTQQLNRAPCGLQSFFQALVTHLRWQLPPEVRVNYIQAPDEIGGPAPDHGR
jgi:hypothetical protein